MKDKEIIELQANMISFLVNELADISKSMSDVNSKIEEYNQQMLTLALPDPEPVIELPTPIETPIKDGSDKSVAITKEEIESIMGNDSRIAIKDNPKDAEYYILYFKGREAYTISKKETLANIQSIINSL